MDAVFESVTVFKKKVLSSVKKEMQTLGKIFSRLLEFGLRIEPSHIFIVATNKEAKFGLFSLVQGCLIFK